jgi:DNA-binding response OmpR family regulator
MSAKILIVDDAEDAARLLKKVLVDTGYTIELAHNGLEGLRQAYGFQPDLILLDVLMPDMDGWTMLQRLREFSNTPVIMLTAVGDESHKVYGLDLGADDYLTKPFGMEELKARIRATLRRFGSERQMETGTLHLDGGRLVIDPSSREVTARGQVIDLTPTEYKLLIYLAFNAGQVLTTTQILDNVWGPGYEDSSTNIKVYIWGLRRKLEADPHNPQYVLTKRGVGYYIPKL